MVLDEEKKRGENVQSPRGRGRAADRRIALPWPQDVRYWGQVVNLVLGPQKARVGGREQAAKAPRGDAAHEDAEAHPEKRGETGMGPTVSPLLRRPLSPSLRRGKPKKKKS